MKKIKIILLSIIVFAILFITGCNEGEDASIFNGVNELKVTGTVGIGSLDFDHENILMKVHLFKTTDFSLVPVKRLSLSWYEKDNQGNIVALNETETTFLDAVSPGEYYACSFIDLNKNSEVDDNEPYDIWRNQDDSHKVISVREESRWEILFLFEKVYSEF